MRSGERYVDSVTALLEEGGVTHRSKDVNIIRHKDRLSEGRATALTTTTLRRRFDAGGALRSSGECGWWKVHYIRCPDARYAPSHIRDPAIVPMYTDDVTM